MTVAGPQSGVPTASALRCFHIDTMPALFLGSSLTQQRIRWLRFDLDKRWERERERESICVHDVPEELHSPDEHTASLFRLLTLLFPHRHLGGWYVGQKQPLFFSFSLLSFSVAFSFCPCWSTLHERWLTVPNTSFFTLISLFFSLFEGETPSLVTFHYFLHLFLSLPVSFPLGCNTSLCLTAVWIQWKSLLSVCGGCSPAWVVVTSPGGSEMQLDTHKHTNYHSWIWIKKNIVCLAPPNVLKYILKYITGEYWTTTSLRTAQYEFLHWKNCHFSKSLI